MGSWGTSPLIVQYMTYTFCSITLAGDCYRLYDLAHRLYISLSLDILDAPHTSQSLAKVA